VAPAARTIASNFLLENQIPAEVYRQALAAAGFAATTAAASPPPAR
jgi:hypothetical protein